MSFSISKSSISFSVPISKPSRRPHFPPSHVKIRCQTPSKIDANISQPDTSLNSGKLMESEKKSDPYPGGMQKMGPFTGRDPNLKKPAWLRQRAPQGERFEEVKQSLSSLKLNTVCEEAQCPNIGECWNGGGDGIATATIMVLGDTCTRGCDFVLLKNQ